MFIALRKSIKEFREIALEVKEKALPTIVSARSLIEDLSPKLKIATSNLAEVSHTLRQQATHVNGTVEALLNKTDAQVRRVDEMATAIFDAVDHVSTSVENAVSVPARRVTGIINAVKAGVEAFVGGKRRPSPNGNVHTEEVEETAPVATAEIAAAAEISAQKPA